MVHERYDEGERAGPGDGGTKQSAKGWKCCREKEVMDYCPRLAKNGFCQMEMTSM